MPSQPGCEFMFAFTSDANHQTVPVGIASPGSTRSVGRHRRRLGSGTSAGDNGLFQQHIISGLTEVR